MKFKLIIPILLILFFVPSCAKKYPQISLKNTYRNDTIQKLEERLLNKRSPEVVKGSGKISLYFKGRDYLYSFTSLIEGERLQIEILDELSGAGAHIEILGDIVSSAYGFAEKDIIKVFHYIFGTEFSLSPLVDVLKGSV
ncbi:hypothetical protein KKA47_01425, partial [bacterium]|nr:hypothetical protein [bacterium]